MVGSRRLNRMDEDTGDGNVDEGVRPPIRDNEMRACWSVDALSADISGQDSVMP